MKWIELTGVVKFCRLYAQQLNRCTYICWPPVAGFSVALASLSFRVLLLDGSEFGNKMKSLQLSLNVSPEEKKSNRGKCDCKIKVVVSTRFWTELLYAVKNVFHESSKLNRFELNSLILITLLNSLVNQNP